jgi:hypothetical protein
MTKGLVRACLKKSKLYGLYRKSGSDEDKNKYNTYKKHLERLLNTAEKLIIQTDLNVYLVICVKHGN